MTLSKEHLAWALCSMMNGVKEHEIHEITGLPQDACKAIWSVYRQAKKEAIDRFITDPEDCYL